MRKVERINLQYKDNCNRMLQIVYLCKINPFY